MASVDAPRTRRTFARLEKSPRCPQPDRHPEEVLRLAGRHREGRACARRSTTSRRSRTTPATSPSVRGVHASTTRSPSIDECREKDLTYARPLTVTVAFINRETGEIREQSVFMGDFPWMTERGTFIINGTERVVVTQLVRSPGAYLMEPKDREKQVFVANLMPARGSWLELEIDKKGSVYVRIDRKRKLPVTVLLRAMGEVLREGHGRGWTHDEEILKLFDNSLYIRNTIDADTEVTQVRGGRADRAVQEAAPGRAAVGRQRQEPAQPAVLRPQALRPHARRPLQAQLAPAPRHRPRHAHAHARRHHRAGQGARRAARRCSASPRETTRTDQGLRRRGA